MISKRYVPRWTPWCVLCPWTGDPSSREPRDDRSWEIHYRDFHMETSRGHRSNGHSHSTMHGWVDECVCGGTFRLVLLGSNVRGECSNARRFGFASTGSTGEEQR